MTFCPNCGAEITDKTAKFCSKCGKTLKDNGTGLQNKDFVFKVKSSRLKYAVIVIIVIAVVVVYLLGTFNYSITTFNTAAGFQPFTVQPGAYTCNTTGLFIELNNSAGQTVKMLNVTISSSSGLVSGTVAKPGKPFNPMSVTTTGVASGNTFVLNLTGNGCSTFSSQYNAIIVLWYSETTGLGTQNLRAIGQITRSTT